MIIGGGVLGATVARELSHYKTDVILVEKEIDFGWWSTKANMCMVCQGGDALEFQPEYLRRKLVWESIPLMEPLCQELEVPFEWVGELTLIRNKDEFFKFQKLKSRAEKIGLPPHQFIDQDTLRRMEPSVTREAIGAMLDPNIAIVDPVRLTLGLIENAVQNGVKVQRETEVLTILQKMESFEVETNQGGIQCRFIVNASGTSTARMAHLLKADDFVLYPIRGFVNILDKNLRGLIQHEVHTRPESLGQMNIITPSVHGNIFFGTTMELARQGDYSTKRKVMEIALRNVRHIIPEISEKDIIHSFSGFLMFRNWKLGWHECVVQASRKVPRLINVCMGYPGVNAAPPKGKNVVELLQQEKLKLKINPTINPFRKASPALSKLPEAQQREWIERDSRYGRVVCRCETGRGKSLMS